MLIMKKRKKRKKVKILFFYSKRESRFDNACTFPRIKAMQIKWQRFSSNRKDKKAKVLTSNLEKLILDLVTVKESLL